jgi:hypothetical protein
MTPLRSITPQVLRTRGKKEKNGPLESTGLQGIRTSHSQVKFSPNMGTQVSEINSCALLCKRRVLN